MHQILLPPILNPNTRRRASAGTTHIRTPTRTTHMEAEPPVVLALVCSAWSQIFQHRTNCFRKAINPPQTPLSTQTTHISASVPTRTHHPTLAVRGMEAVAQEAPGTATRLESLDRRMVSLLPMPLPKRS